jgi:hypothetical protein
MTEEDLLAKKQEYQKELKLIEDNLPSTYHDLLTNIDMYIFGAQKGFDIATKLVIICSGIEVQKKNAFKKAWALAFLDAKDTAPSVKDHEAKAKSVNEAADMHLAEAKSKAADLIREQFLEKLNTYKKIKSDNINMRGTNS